MASTNVPPAPVSPGRDVVHVRDKSSNNNLTASLAQTPRAGAVKRSPPQAQARRAGSTGFNSNQHGTGSRPRVSAALDSVPKMVRRQLNPSQSVIPPGSRVSRSMRPPPPPPPPPYPQLVGRTGISSETRPPRPPPSSPPPSPPPPPRSGGQSRLSYPVRQQNPPLFHRSVDLPRTGSETASNQTFFQSHVSDSSDYDSDYSDATSTFTYPDGGRPEIWAAVELKQRQIWRIRSEMAKNRKGLKHLLQRMSDLDARFMRSIRPHFAINKQFRDLQAARDEFYPAIAAYDVMERELNDEEVELETLEADVIRAIHEHTDAVQSSSFSRGHEQPIIYNSQVAPPQSSKNQPLGMDSRASLLLGISGERHEDIHPLYQELLSAAGDRELAREFCEELTMRYEEILYDLETKIHRRRLEESLGRSISEEDLKSLKASLEHIPPTMEEFQARFGVEINEDDLEFVQSYESEKQRAELALEKASETVNKLRDLCIQKGVIRKHASYAEEVAIFAGSSRAPAPADGNMSIETLPSNRSGGLAHPRFPILLSNPSYVLKQLTARRALAEAMALPQDSPDSAQRRAECMKELGITNLMKNAENKPDYINQWLIHRLRTTPLEAELMLTIFEMSHKVTNVRKWQEDVLFHWRQDEAARISPSQFEGPRTPRDELDIDDGRSTSGLNSVIEGSTRAKSENGDDYVHRHHHHHHHHHHLPHHRRNTWSRTVQSVC